MHKINNLGTSSGSNGQQNPLKQRYSVNPKNGGGHSIESWQGEQFSSVERMKSELGEEFADHFQFGYLMPGHGMNGKQRPIESHADLTTMFSEYRGKRCILLWIKCQKPSVTKRSRPTSPDMGASEDVQVPKAKRAGPAYSAHMKNLHEVEEILETLKQKHEENFTPEQLRTWAHMIQMKKHSSYDTAPDKPFFRSKSKKTTAATTSTVTDAVISSVNKVNMRSELIQQIDKWYDLKQKGAISEAQYEELQAVILSDIKNF